MIAIVCLYIFKLCSFLGAGLLVTWCLKRYDVNFRQPSFAKLCLLGIALQSMLVCLWASFWAVNHHFTLFLICISAFGFYLEKHNLRLPRTNLSYLFVAYCVVIIAQSASAPYFFDNDSYFLQTTKWIEQFGLVKGLANLHPFLGQMSPWHMLQAVYSFHFVGFDFNDLNGFLAIIVGFEFFNQWKKYNTVQRNIATGYFIFLILWFRFIDSPSPDFVVYALSFWLFTDLMHPDYKNLNYWLYIVPFAVFVKILALPIFVITATLYPFVNKSKPSPLWLLWATGFGLLFITKNLITSGLPFYPWDPLSSIFTLDWKIPETFMQTKGYAEKAYLHTSAELAQMSLPTKLKSWFMHPGLSGIFNKLSVFIFTGTPLFVWFTKKSITVRIICSLLFLFFVGFLCSSPQPRFFVHWLPLSLLIVIPGKDWMKKYHKTLIIFGLLLATASSSFPIDLKRIANNSYMNKLPLWTVNQIIKPHPRTRYPNLNYRQTDLGSVSVNHYVDCQNSFLFLTFDAEIPAVCPKLWDHYTKQGYTLIPLGKTPSQGFKVVKEGK